MARNYKMSVIMPIYNVEEYLREAIDSVINQTMPFEDIQLILINDGSTDGSEELCKEYQEKYPEDITYIYKENGGVSSARNMGFEHIQAKYVTFLDPDDMWEETSFENAYNFFEKHYDEIDVLEARIKFFEANENYHSLDYKFRAGTRIADLNSEKEMFTIQSTAATCFIKSEALGDLRFDPRLKHGEDSTFINKLILKRCKVGVIEEALYLYRRREGGGSAVNNQLRSKSFYTDSIDYYHNELFNYSRQLYGKVIPYVQAMVGYDLMWRFATPEVKETLNEEEYGEYEKKVRALVGEIDDRILLRSPIHGSIFKKRDAMYYKYGIEIYDYIRLDGGILKYGDYPILNLVRNKTRCVQVVNSEIKGTKLVIEILISSWFFKCQNNSARLVFRINEKDYPAELEEYNVTKYKTLDGEQNYYKLARCEFDIAEALKSKGSSLTVLPVLQLGESETNLSLDYGKFVPSTTRVEPTYKFFGETAMKCYQHSIKLYNLKHRRLTKFKWDIDYAKELISRKRFDILKKRFISYPLFKFRNRSKGRIWLISDRIDNAGDNGEVLFKYICSHKPEGVRPVFVIGSIARDEVKQRLRGIGEVVLAEDKNYPYYFLCAEKIISSSAGEFTINAFDENRHYFHDLYNFKYYFMNHGVNCGDCSRWLNRFNKNIHIMFSTGISERQNIIDRDYNYSPEQVVITGLARFDALYEDTKKQLLVLPTWRRAYKNCYDEKTSSIYYDGFKETDYYKFYNGLINDERLLEVMRKKGYNGLFCLHPIFMKQSVDFVKNDVFEINDGFVDYNKVFAESSVMVTDYSTIAFDFAYLSKPIVYTQFDREEFYANQVYDECFDYDKEGFGPVCTDLDSAVNELIRVIENDCKNDYIERTDAFFVNRDKNNARRILEAVLADDEKDS